MLTSMRDGRMAKPPPSNASPSTSSSDNSSPLSEETRPPPTKAQKKKKKSQSSRSTKKAAEVPPKPTVVSDGDSTEGPFQPSFFPPPQPIKVLPKRGLVSDGYSTEESLQRTPQANAFPAQQPKKTAPRMLKVIRPEPPRVTNNGLDLVDLGDGIPPPPPPLKLAFIREGSDDDLIGGIEDQAQPQHESSSKDPSLNPADVYNFDQFLEELMRDNGSEDTSQRSTTTDSDSDPSSPQKTGEPARASSSSEDGFIPPEDRSPVSDSSEVWIRPTMGEISENEPERKIMSQTERLWAEYDKRVDKNANPVHHILPKRNHPIVPTPYSAAPRRPPPPPLPPLPRASTRQESSMDEDDIYLPDIDDGDLWGSGEERELGSQSETTQSRLSSTASGKAQGTIIQSFNPSNMLLKNPRPVGKAPTPPLNPVSWKQRKGDFADAARTHSLPPDKTKLFKKIRRVEIHDITPYTPLYLVLNQVRGGALDFVIYDATKGHMQIMFMEHDAAFAFWSYTSKDGMYIPSELAPGAPGPPYIRARVAQFLSPKFKPDESATLISKVNYGVATRVLILCNLPRGLHLGNIKDDIFRTTSVKDRRPSRPDELFEDAYYVRDRTEKIEYWPVHDGYIALSNPTTLTDALEPELWTEMGGNAVIVSLSSVSVAVTTIQRLRSLPGYANVQFGFVGDNCALPLDTLEALSPEEKIEANKWTEWVRKRDSEADARRGTPIPQGPKPGKMLHGQYIEGGGYNSRPTLSGGALEPNVVNRDKVAIYFTRLPLDVTAAELSAAIRGGKLHSIQIFRNYLPTVQGASSGEALVLFFEEEAAERYVRFCLKHPESNIRGYYFQVSHGGPRGRLDQIPRLIKMYPDCTRVLCFDHLYEVGDPKTLQTLIDKTVGHPGRYEHVHVAPGMALVTYYNVDDAREAFLRIVSAKKRSEDWRLVHINYFTDQCQGTLHELLVKPS